MDKFIFLNTNRIILFKEDPFVRRRSLKFNFFKLNANKQRMRHQPNWSIANI